MDSIKLAAIDELTYKKHCELTSTDIRKCFYWRFFYPKQEESQQSYTLSKTNSLIQNLKRPPNCPDSRLLYYRKKAIQQVANELKTILTPFSQRKNFFIDTFFVPIPPSKTKEAPDYNSRNVEILEEVKKAFPTMQIQELIYQKKSTSADHFSTKRQTVQQLIDNYSVQESMLIKLPKRIILFDDVITAGRHFKAIQTIFSQRQPLIIEVFGFFIARAVNPQDPDLISMENGPR